MLCRLNPSVKLGTMLIFSMCMCPLFPSPWLVESMHVGPTNMLTMNTTQNCVGGIHFKRLFLSEAPQPSWLTFWARISLPSVMGDLEEHPVYN